ncbi:MAG TPA: hypothetical protein VNC23_07355 [Lapillicoccus sp.]|jgi:hypothetical protein|nr:hypothetical protein [Lapillicoccus sp.]
MADGDGGGSSAAGIAVIVAVLIGFVAGGRSTTETTTTTNSGSTTSSSSSTGSGSTTTVRSSSTVVTSSTTEAPTPLASCPGSVVRQTTENGITLRLYYDSQAGGVNCVTAVHDGAVTPPGYLQTELRFATSVGTAWPVYATQVGAAGAAQVTGTYLIRTNDRCVTAVATYYSSGSGGPSTSASLTRVACG